MLVGQVSPLLWRQVENLEKYGGHFPMQLMSNSTRNALPVLLPWKEKTSQVLWGHGLPVWLRCSFQAGRSEKLCMLFFFFFLKPAGSSVDWRCLNAFQECWHIFMLSLFMQALPQEPASRLSASHQGRRKEASCQGTSAVVVFVLEGICIMKDNISWLQKVAISQCEMPASISGMVVTRGDLSWDTQSFCIWSLVQITTSLAGIESLDHLVTQMNSSRWTGALITVGALIDWTAKAEWKGRFTVEVWVPCSAQALRMENFDSSALSVCHAAQRALQNSGERQWHLSETEGHSHPGTLPTLPVLIQRCALQATQGLWEHQSS